MQPLMQTHASVFVDVHVAMALVASGRDDLLQVWYCSFVLVHPVVIQYVLCFSQEFLDSLRKYAYEGSFYSEAYSSSISTTVDPVEDVDWMWNGIENEWSEEGFEQAAKELQNKSKSDEENKTLTKRSLDPGLPNKYEIQGEISYFPQNVGDPRSYDTSYVPIPEFELGDHLSVPDYQRDDPFAQEELTAYGAGGYEERPVLTCPMSTLPVLPLRPHSVQDDGVDDVVSIGGVGGFGLGSHSIHDQRYLAATIGVPLVEGLAAYRQGYFELCVDKLMPLRSIWQYIGGSHAQLDVFSQTLEAACTQSKQYLLSRALLRERMTNNPNSGLALYHLSSVLFGTGEYRKAAHARDRALRLGLGEERVGTPQVRAMTRTEDSWYQ